MCGFIAGGCFFVAENRKNSPNPLTKKGKMGRMKPIRKFFRERRGMVMGRRILAVLAALLALLWAAVPAYAASPAVDSAYLTREPWQNVPVTEFRADGAMGYYQIHADTDNHCLYFAVSMQDQQVEPGANTAAVALNLQVSSAKFSTRKFTFTTGANKALQSYDGIASSCNMQVEILENSGGSGGRQVGVVDLHIIGKRQLAGAADHSMVAVVPEQQPVGEGDISLRRFVPQRRIKVPTSSISYKKRTR